MNQQTASALKSAADREGAAPAPSRALALAMLKRGKADALLVVKLDRLTPPARPSSGAPGDDPSG